MNLVAVTLGVGDIHEKAAQSACKEVETVLNLKTRIITKDFLYLGIGDNIGHQIASLKFQIFNIFPDLEYVMFFDSDWRPLKYFNILDFCPQYNRAYFVADRSDYWYVQNLEKEFNFEPSTYINSGWFLVNKKAHKHLLNACKEKYYSYPPTFYKEQDMFNHIFHSEMILADRRLNVLDLGVFPYDEILGLHNKEENYRYYNLNT